MTILERLDILEQKVDQFMTRTDLEVRFTAYERELGSLIAKYELLQKRLETVQLPEDVTYFMSKAEVNFLRDGISQVSSLLAELTQIRNNLVRAEAARN